jgi:hypothetical protein
MFSDGKKKLDLWIDMKDRKTKKRQTGRKI